ncbi:peptide deformylase [candidate division KSB1 bacterium 4484_87]|nr:MAG: peptide deformylase [candidate division KSB1 bacterium 4484_87]
MRVIKYGNPILRMKAKRVEKVDHRIRQLVNEMIEIMRDEEGIGLAAPQVAESISLLVVDHSLIEEDGEPSAYLNPEILAAEGESVFEEGCLSIPDVREDVKRPEVISVRYEDIDGNIHEKKVDGLLARVLQHEIDHLNGILFVDRISPVKKKMIQKKLKQIAAEEREAMAQVA